MCDKSKEVNKKHRSITVGLVPAKIVAKESLKEFNELVRKFQAENNATDEMSIVAYVTLTVRDLV